MVSGLDFFQLFPKATVSRDFFTCMDFNATIPHVT